MQKTKLTHSSTASFRFFTSNATRSALAVVVAITLGGASLPAIGATTVSASSALASLKVRSWSSHNGYARSAFSDGWGNIGECDTRNYILKRDLSNITWRTSPTCTVSTGTLRDHVVALSNAWVTGASVLSATARYNIYNDPLNLLAVDGPTNESKSDSDASAWLPPNRGYRCAYVARQIAVKRKYHLWVTASEKAAMADVLATCPKQALPTG